MHPLAQGMRRMAIAPDQIEWAEQAGAQIEALVAAALVSPEPEQARARLGAAIRGLYEHARPYVGLPVAQPWIEATHRRLQARAQELFGPEASFIVAPLHHEPMPAPARRPGPRSPFGG